MAANQDNQGVGLPAHEDKAGTVPIDTLNTPMPAPFFQQVRFERSVTFLNRHAVHVRREFYVHGTLIVRGNLTVNGHSTFNSGARLGHEPNTTVTHPQYVLAPLTHNTMVVGQHAIYHQEASFGEGAIFTGKEEVVNVTGDLFVDGNLVVLGAAFVDGLATLRGGHTTTRLWDVRPNALQ